MILHVAGLDKFIPPFIDLIHENFDVTEHRFWLAGDKEKYPYETRDNIYQVKRTKVGVLKGLLYLLVQLHKAEKVILHGLFDPRIILLLFLMPWLLKKCYWVMWGGDLYTYQFGERNWKWKVKEFLRRPVIKKMGYLVNGTPGDVELARQWYCAQGQHITCFNYTSNIYRPLPFLSDRSGQVNILAGNSADPSNNHFLIFDKLKDLVEDNHFIYCPLSYGDQSYAEEVCREGVRLFGEKFKPIRNFMSLDEYMSFLACIDIAIFDHHRQQAFGNTLSLLGFGKKVYINSVSTLNDVFERYYIKVFDSASINLTPIEDDVALNNKRNVEKYFSEQSLVESLKKWVG